MEHDILSTDDGRRIAYRRTEGNGPGIVFLGGLRSDMTGTKAEFLESWANEHGRAFLRFDYTGHGSSSGRFEDGCISDWTRDAIDATDALTTGPQILVGSSMGGWISLSLATCIPDRIAGFVGIAVAPDFTEDLMWTNMSPAIRDQLMSAGQIKTPSEYSESPYVISRRLIEDGRSNLVLRNPLQLPFPVRLLHGTRDADVPAEVALRLLNHVECDDMRLTLVKGSDHRFSADRDLSLLAQAIREVTDVAEFN